MKKIFAFWLAVLIEYRWFWIMHYRKKGNHLLEHGEALSSDRLIKLTKRLTTTELSLSVCKINMKRWRCCPGKGTASSISSKESTQLLQEGRT